MIQPNPKSMPQMVVTSDRTQEVLDILKGFKNDAVLVGIPAAEASRDDEVSQEINNASLLAINEFGAEELHIPARPVMKLGIAAAQDQIAVEFKKAAQNALTSGLSALRTYYERAGIIASTSVKKQINSQEGIEEPAESTLAARRSRGFKGIKALIVTGQLRNAITYVINGGGY